MPGRVYPPYERRHQPRRTEADRTKFNEANTVGLKKLDISIQKTASGRELVVLPTSALKPMYLQQFVNKYEQLRPRVQAACKCRQFCELQKDKCRHAALKAADIVYQEWAAQDEKDKEQQAGENVVVISDDEDEDGDGNQAHPQRLVHGGEGDDEEVEGGEQRPPPQQGQQEEEEEGWDVYGAHPSTPPATQRREPRAWAGLTPELDGLELDSPDDQLDRPSDIRPTEVNVSTIVFTDCVSCEDDA